MHALNEQEADARMAQVVKPDAPQSGLANDEIEIFIKRARLKRCSDPGRKQESAILPLRAGHKTFFELRGHIQI
jgi:hypothetical protein